MEETSGSSGFGVSIRSYSAWNTASSQHIEPGVMMHERHMLRMWSAGSRDSPMYIFVDGFHWSAFSMPMQILPVSLPVQASAEAYPPSLSMLG